MRYYGITLGPIHETISSVTKPAGLWMASYFFSSITRDLCKKILDIGNGKVSIISPYFKDGDEINGKEDGIGRYHDRVIFVYAGNDEADFEKDLEKAFSMIKRIRAREIANCLEKSETEVIDYINKYIYIKCIGISTIDDNNVLKTMSSKLDALELMESVRPSGDTRFVLSVLNNNDHVKRYKECSLVDPSEMSGGFYGIRNALTKNENGAIKEIESIAKGDCSFSQYKISNYFAVVYADGDHMGTVVKKLGDEVEGTSPEERQMTFSRHCLEYTSESAKLINQYGGITIYAGGDDLLFLAPLKNKEKTIFDLCQNITEKFNSTFTKEREMLNPDKKSDEDFGPSLSYGISINYYRYPLYEAVEDARRLLFDVAKFEDEKTEDKKIKRIYNSVALGVRKASGQKVEMVLKQGREENSTMEQMKNVLSSFINRSKAKNGEKQGQDISELANNAIFTLENQKSVISKIWSGIAISEKRKNVLDNFFDNDSQNTDTAMLCKLGDAISCDKGKEMIRIKDVDADDEAFIVNGITSVLRVCKFFVEKGDEGR